jgi:4-aminobutyrate aminotransferase-like enzyme
MLKRLAEIQEKSSIVDNAEGIGLMIGMEIVADKQTRNPASNDVLTRIMNEMAAKGVLVGRGGLYYNRIRLEPPLCITKDEADKTLNVFEEVIKEIENRN